MNKPRSILSPIEQRIYGVVQIVQGVGWVIAGDRIPSLTLSYIKRKNRQKFKLKEVPNGTSRVRA